MPIYEYACKACGHQFDVLQKVSDPVLTDCPECGQPELRKLISAPVFRLKGKGWYETDFKSDKENKRNLAGDGEAKPASAAGEKERRQEGRVRQVRRRQEVRGRQGDRGQEKCRQVVRWQDRGERRLNACECRVRVQVLRAAYRASPP